MKASKHCQASSCSGAIVGCGGGVPLLAGMVGCAMAGCYCGCLVGVPW